MQVIDAAAIRYAMAHPARGFPFTVRELAPKLGCSIGTLSHMRHARRATIPALLAERFAEAVGAETELFFAPPASRESDTTTKKAS